MIQSLPDRYFAAIELIDKGEYQQALGSLYDILKDCPQHDKVLRGVVCQELSSVYFRLKRYEESLEAAAEGIAASEHGIIRASCYKWQSMVALDKLASQTEETPPEEKKALLDKALSLIKEAIKVFPTPETEQDAEDLIVLYQILTFIYKSVSGQWAMTAAITALKKAVKISEEFKLSEEYTQLMSDLASTIDLYFYAGGEDA